jgi:hypothetical protein
MLMDKTDGEDEIKIWKHGWKFNYLVGQLNYVASHYGKRLSAYIENPYYFRDLEKQKKKGVVLLNKKINIALLSQVLKEGKVIVYLDTYHLHGILHAPHFVIATRRVGDYIEIADPYDGKVKRVSVGVIKKSIDSLRKHLKYSPVLVTVG